MRLRDLLERLPGAELRGDPALEITDVTHDSRRAGPGSLFVAIRGLVTDGGRFVEAARRKGAVAVCSEEPPSGEGTWVRVADAREALATLAAAILGDPARSLDLVGVTGTNGKTTTTHLVDAALRAAGEAVGLVGTVQYRVGNRIAEAVRTTPESSDLQALLREMADAGCRRAVLEVSSHSLALKRVHGLEFRVAVFTNLTRDHLDFHGDMDAYFEAKRRLFERHLRADGHAVVNLDDDRGPDVVAASRGRVFTYSVRNPKADLLAEDDPALPRRHALPRADPRRRPGGGDAAPRRLQRAERPRRHRGRARPRPARGRRAAAGSPPFGRLGPLERVVAGQDFTVLVDYAHTDDALKNLLETVRGLRPRRVVTVFGCGGDRDRTKRPLMGAVAARLSDVVILTSDNPRSEPPEAILAEIRRGIPAARGARTRS